MVDRGRPPADRLTSSGPRSAAAVLLCGALLACRDTLCTCLPPTVPLPTCVAACVEYVLARPRGVLLRVGDTARVSWIVRTQGAADTTVEWTSRDSAIATIDKLGLVTAVAPGRVDVDGKPVIRDAGYDRPRFPLWALTRIDVTTPTATPEPVLAELRDASHPDSVLWSHDTAKRDSLAFDVQYLIGTNDALKPMKLEFVVAGYPDTLVIGVPLIAPPGQVGSAQVVVRARTRAGVRQVRPGAYYMFARLIVGTDSSRMSSQYGLSFGYPEGP